MGMGDARPLFLEENRMETYGLQLTNNSKKDRHSVCHASLASTKQKHAGMLATVTAFDIRMMRNGRNVSRTIAPSCTC